MKGESTHSFRLVVMVGFDSDIGRFWSFDLGRIVFASLFPFCFLVFFVFS